MKTDKLFYAIFLFRTRLLSELIPGLDPTCEYDYAAPVVKETEYRIDGVFTPLEPTLEQPIVFVEAQMQPDPGFYSRFFAEVYVYLDHYAIERPWRGLLILQSRNQRLGNPRPYIQLLENQVQPVYLEDLAQADNLSPTLRLFQLLVLDAQATIPAAQTLLELVARESDFTKWLGVVEAIVVSKFPEAGLEGVRKMLGIQTENLSHTQFYQDVLKIGQEQGRQQGIQLGEQRGIQLGEQRGIQLGEQRGIQLGEQRGIQLGEQRGEANIILRLLTYRFGQIDHPLEAEIRALTTEKLEALSQALLEFENLLELQAWVETVTTSIQ
jgi:predicted transposase/invertase (TIGR01784 family)